MGNLLILTDANITSILLTLSKPEIIAFQTTLSTCLQSFSSTSEGSLQPQPSIITRPEGQKCLFRPFTSPTSAGAKIIVQPAAAGAALHGMIALCDASGIPTGLLNAEDITAYRTSLCALIPFTWRRRTQRILLFGAGKQALWHLRLMLALRGAEIASITVLNRTASRATALISQIRHENALYWRSDAAIAYLDPRDATAYESSLRDLVGAADAIFCTTGSTTPLFPASYRTAGRQVYISAIGAWQPDMIELDPALLTGLAETRTGSSGALLVDDRTAVLQHSGEALQSGLKSEDVVEIGDVIRQMAHEQTRDPLLPWLQDGFLVYKSVGVGMMDLAASNAILDIARERGVGAVIPDF
ncbi:NAD(P)-binding protein [Xylaria sp. CBS 124048]|nr:NAD(P)-binding protein [Xylaria sp. CBS 124048]